MSELDTILSNMESLSSIPDSYSPGSPGNGLGIVAETDANTDDKAFHDEDISNEFARSLLRPEDYDPFCHYKMMTSMENIVIVKINDNLPEGVEERGFNKRITEYVLENTDEVQSFEQMRKAILNPKLLHDETTSVSHYESQVKNNWWIIPTFLFCVLLVLGIYLLYYLM